MNNHTVVIEELTAKTGNMGEIIERHSNEVHELQLHKTDNIKFEAHLESVDDKLGNMKEYVEKTRNMVIGCENYLEKY